MRRPLRNWIGVQCSTCICVLLLPVGQARAGETTATEVAKIRLPELIVGTLLAEEIERRGAVDNYIGGTHNVGTSVTRAVLNVEFVPNGQAASLRFRLKGACHAKTCGTVGPVRFDHRSVTELMAAKRVLFDGRRFTWEPAECSGSTALVTDDISCSLGGLRGRMAERIAAHKQEQKLDQIENEIFADVARQVCEEFDRDVEKSLQDAQRVVDGMRRFAGSLPRISDSVTLAFSTGDDDLTVRIHRTRPRANVLAVDMNVSEAAAVGGLVDPE